MQLIETPPPAPPPHDKLHRNMIELNCTDSRSPTNTPPLIEKKEDNLITENVLQ